MYWFLCVQDASHVGRVLSHVRKRLHLLWQTRTYLLNHFQLNFHSLIIRSEMCSWHPAAGNDAYLNWRFEHYFCESHILISLPALAAIISWGVITLAQLVRIDSPLAARWKQYSDTWSFLICFSVIPYTYLHVWRLDAFVAQWPWWRVFVWSKRCIFWFGCPIPTHTMKHTALYKHHRLTIVLHCLISQVCKKTSAPHWNRLTWNTQMMHTYETHTNRWNTEMKHTHVYLLAAISLHNVCVLTYLFTFAQTSMIIYVLTYLLTYLLRYLYILIYILTYT